MLARQAARWRFPHAVGCRTPGAASPSIVGSQRIAVVALRLWCLTPPVTRAYHCGRHVARQIASATVVDVAPRRRSMVPQVEPTYTAPRSCYLENQSSHASATFGVTREMQLTSLRLLRLCAASVPPSLMRLGGFRTRWCGTTTPMVYVCVLLPQSAPPPPPPHHSLRLGLPEDMVRHDYTDGVCLCPATTKRLPKSHV